MADIPPPTPGGYDLMNLLLMKILPATAGAYARNLFPPRKPLWQRICEAIGSIWLAIHLSDMASAALWGVFAWAMGFVGVDDISALIDRQAVDKTAVVLVALFGLTAVEGVILFLRRWFANPTQPTK